jgi:hypothetical protein
MSNYIPFPTKYSAIRVGSDGRASRLFCDGNFSRLETFHNGVFDKKVNLAIEPQEILITRPDLKKLFDIKIEEKIIYEIKLPSDFAKTVLDEEMIWRHVGKVNHDGFLCDKYELRNSGEERVSEVVLINIRTKMRAQVTTYDKIGNQAFTMKWLNVELGAPDPRLFEIPKDLKIIKL